jgi:hypothetical protein
MANITAFLELARLQHGGAGGCNVPGAATPRHGCGPRPVNRDWLTRRTDLKSSISASVGTARDRLAVVPWLIAGTGDEATSPGRITQDRHYQIQPGRNLWPVERIVQTKVGRVAFGCA